MAGILNWDLGDGSTRDSNSFSYTYAGPGNKTVTINKGTTSSPAEIRYLDMTNDNLVGVLDISCFTSCASIILGSNAKLTQIINPAVNDNISYYSANITGISSADFSMMSHLGGQFNLSSCPSLNTVIFPSSPAVFKTFYLNNCALVGTLDVSGLTGLGGDFNVTTNPRLNQILFPNSSTLFTSLYASDCGLMGTMDISGLTRLGGNIYFQANPSLNYILNPSTNEAIGSYNCYGTNSTTLKSGLKGTLDLRPLKKISGTLNFNYNPSLNSILLPDNLADVSITGFYADYCDLIGTLDLSKYYNMKGPISAKYNLKMGGFVPPNTSNNITGINIENSQIIGTIDLRHLDLSGGLNFRQNPSINHIYFPASSRVISQIYFDYMRGWTGTIDLSGFTNLSNQFFCDMQMSNPYQYLHNWGQYFIFPNSPQPFNYFWMTGTRHWGSTLDISGLTGLGGSINISGNPSINTIIFPKVASNAPNISSLILTAGSGYDKFTGTLDISGLTNLGGYVTCNGHPNLKMILFPDTCTNTTAFSGTTNLNSNDLTGTLDLSGLHKLAGNLYISSNYHLNQIIMPDTSGHISYIQFGQNALMGTLDLRGMQGQTGSWPFVCYYNPSLNEVKFPTTSIAGSPNYTQGYNCGLTIFDVSCMPGLSGQFNMWSCSKLQNIWLPTLTAKIHPFLAQDCSLTSASIDDILGKFDAWYAVNSVTTDTSILLNGGNSDKPTVDGSTHIANIKARFATFSKTADIRVN